ncbi:lysozyme inhibitor LprI family protein [Methylobacterium sp. W2]|uniref:lysozyme inhibitor LprI family protein n=1 Tax=Methylobacterium sp. W2 TaxID=2598107 RepID=UPI001D0C5F87|nr:lysozyme inhibitor LprI family protein [Methylobacterium sp. W2]
MTASSLSVMMTVFLTFPTIGRAETPKHCDTATDAVDRAICTNPAAKSADDGMVKAYTNLHHSFDSVSGKALLEGQRKWLQTRSQSCSDKGKDLVACIITSSKDRMDALRSMSAAIPEDGPGLLGALVPYDVGADGKDGEWNRSASLFRFNKPSTDAERAFNLLIDKAVSDLPVKMDGAGGGETGTWSVDGTLVYASPSFISICVDADEYAQGAAHGLSWTQNINFDLRSGKAVTITDWFDEKARHLIDKTCFSQIRKQWKRQDGDQVSKAQQTEDDRNIETLELADARKQASAINEEAAHWTFDSTSATITYDQRAISEYPGGKSECTLPLHVVKKLSSVPIPIE